MPAGSDLHGAGFGFKQIFIVLKARWWMVVLAVAATVGGAWFLVPPDRDLYLATSVVRLDDARSQLSAGFAAQGDPLTNDLIQSQVHVVRSAELVQSVVDRLGLSFWPGTGLPFQLISDIRFASESVLADTLWISLGRQDFVVRNLSGQEVTGRYGEPIDIGNVGFTLAAPPEEVTEEVVVPILPRSAAVLAVTNALSVNQRDYTTILDINYADPDSVRSLRVVNEITRVYRTFNASGAQDRARQTREFLQEQLIQATATFDRNQELLRQYQQADRSFGSATRVNQEQATLLAIDGQRRQLTDERTIYRSFLDRVRTARGERLDAELRSLIGAPGMTANPLLAQLYGQIAGYLVERERGLASGFSPTNPEITRLDALIESTRGQVAEFTETHIASLDLRIRSLDDQYARATTSLMSMPETGAEELRLTAEVENARAMVNAVRVELQRASLAESLEVSQVQVLENASFAMPTTEGARNLTLMIALVLGLLLGGGGSLLMEVMNSSVRGSQELEGILAIPALGVIPRISNGRPSPPPQQQVLSRKDQIALPKSADAADKQYSPALAVNGSAGFMPTEADDFDSAAAEAYRILRTNLVFLTPDRNLRTLLVTSATSAEGKTTTAANLAVAFARQGKRVLLVDCDLRRPRLHNLFGVPRTPGFTDLLLGEANLSQVVSPTLVERLYLLPRGPFREEAAEMLSGDGLRQQLTKFRGHWDLVIIDTSPVLLTADAAAIAPYVDGVILVVCAGRTSRDAAKHAMQQLQVVGSSILGFVLNDPKEVGGRYGEYKYAKEYYRVEA